MLAQNPSEALSSLNTMMKKSEETLRTEFWELLPNQVVAHTELIDEEKAKLIQLHLAQVSLSDEKRLWLHAYYEVLGETDYS
jgi:hypothetical protein